MIRLSYDLHICLVQDILASVNVLHTSSLHEHIFASSFAYDDKLDGLDAGAFAKINNNYREFIKFVVKSKCEKDKGRIFKAEQSYQIILI